MIEQLKTVEAYDRFTRQTGVVIVHFGANWNAHDRTMQRTLIELEPEFQGKVIFGAIDTDQNSTIELLERINLVNTPTLVYFRNGKHVATNVGMRPMDEIRIKITTLLDQNE